MTHDQITGARWFKSSHSKPERECVEVAFLDTGHVALRDTKNHTTGPTHTFPNAEWTTFLTTIKDGELDKR